MTIKTAFKVHAGNFFPIRYQSIKLILREKSRNHLEKGKKRVPLQPANEETKLAEKFIKELEKAKREREKDFKKSFVKEKINSHLCSRFEKEAEVLKKVRKRLRSRKKESREKPRKTSKNK